MTTRSAVLSAGSYSARHLQNIYTCPLGAVVLVKSFYANVNANQPSRPYLQVVRPGVAGVQILLPLETDTRYVFWSGWFVLEGTDYLQFNVDDGVFSWWLSGAVLPARPPTP